MDGKLVIQAILKFALVVLLVGILVFLPVGTVAFRQGWLILPESVSVAWLLCFLHHI